MGVIIDAGILNLLHLWHLSIQSGKAKSYILSYPLVIRGHQFFCLAEIPSEPEYAPEIRSYIVHFRMCKLPELVAQPSLVHGTNLIAYGNCLFPRTPDTNCDRWIHIGRR